MEQQEGRTDQTKHGGPRTSHGPGAKDQGGTSTASSINTTSKVSWWNAYPLWTAARHSVLVRTRIVNSKKKKKKQAIPKQTLYTAE